VAKITHRPRVLLADDHPRVAEVMAEYVAEAFQLVGTVRDGDALLESAKLLQPDVILADISMPGTDGMSAMKEIQRRFPEIRVILLTSYGDPSLARYALDAGAAGFVVKAYAPTDLVAAIRAVVSGATYVSRAIAL
jgi:DNA-binding NarL/FixJ family response regulator